MKTVSIKKILAALMIVLFAATLSSCGSAKKTVSDEDGQPNLDAHVMTKAEEKELKKDLKENVEIINKAHKDSSTLSKALTGDLLKNTLSQIATDSANGMIKVRKYSSPKFEIKNYTKGVVGVTMNFTDKGYFIDKETEKKVTKPKNEKTSLILALQKEDDHWKIFELLQEAESETTTTE